MKKNYLDPTITMCYGLDMDFPVYMHRDLDLGDMSLGQGHDTPLGH